MSATSRVAGAVAAGYVLGRFKKLRLAVLVASAMASPKFRSAAAGLIQDRIPGGAIVGGLTREAGGRLLDAGKAAATTVVASRIDTLSQSLADRSESLRKATPGAQAGKSRADQPTDDRASAEPTDEYEEPEGEEAEEREGEEVEEPRDEYEEPEGEEAEEPADEYEVREGEEVEEPRDEYEEPEGEEAEEPTDEYEEREGEEAEEPADEYEEREGEEAEEPTDEYEPEEPVVRSPRRRRSASPAGRR
jgi:hypothetical protein